MVKFMRILKVWYPLAFAVTVVCGLAYAAVQQDYRQSANDPQIQMAEDAATGISQGAAPQSFIPRGSVDISTSLAPYLVFYNASGTPLFGNASFDGGLPNLPPGVFPYTANAGEDRITWQPAPGVRQAAVIVHITGPGPAAYVLAGRSLREVEWRENQLELITDITWIMALIGTFALEAWVVLTK